MQINIVVAKKILSFVLKSIVVFEIMVGSKLVITTRIYSDIFKEVHSRNSPKTLKKFEVILRKKLNNVAKFGKFFKKFKCQMLQTFNNFFEILS